MFDSKINRYDSASAVTDLELTSFRNEGTIKFPQRNYAAPYCTPHKIALNMVRVYLAACIILMAISWQKMRKIGVDLADVASTKDYISSLLLTSEQTCKISTEPIIVSDLGTEGLYSLIALSIVTCIISFILLSFAQIK